MKCTCPTKFDEHSRAIVRASLDQFCPLHGAKKQELPHCATCTCGAATPIVQTPQVAMAQAAAAEARDPDEAGERRDDRQ